MKLGESYHLYKNKNYKVLYYKRDIPNTLKEKTSIVSIDSEWLCLDLEKGNCRIVVLYFNNTLVVLFIEKDVVPINFINLLEDDSIKKLLHSARNDYYIFHIEWKEHFKTTKYVNVECTKYLSVVNSNFTGTSSLNSLLNRELDETIDKTWLSNNYLNLDKENRKPIFEYDNVRNDPSLIQYLLEDVVYLERLYFKLLGQLNALKIKQYNIIMEIGQNCIEIVSETKSYKFLRCLFHDNEFIL